MTSFQDRIKLTLEHHSVSKISERTNISKSQLYRICEPGRDTTRGNIEAISKATGVSILWLVSGEGPMYLDGTPAPTLPTPKPQKSTETTQPESENLSSDELELLELFRNSSLMRKMQVVQLLSGHQTSAEPLPEAKNDVPANEEQPQ